MKKEKIQRGDKVITPKGTGTIVEIAFSWTPSLYYLVKINDDYEVFNRDKIKLMKKEITINGEKYIKADCEECKEKKNPYKLKKGDDMHWLTSEGVVASREVVYIDKFEPELKQGNVFRTKEEAEHERDKREAIFKIKKYIYDNFGYDPTDWADWEDDTYKIEISYEYELYEFDFYCHNSSKSYSPIGYLKTEDQAQEIIDEFEEELEIIFDVE